MKTERAEHGTQRARLALAWFAALGLWIAGASKAETATSVDASSSFEQDRAAILAMAGEYRVTFQFQETVAIEPGYTLKAPYHAAATEFVEVAEDAGDRIVLQHVLVLKPKEEGAEPRVVKHWRQDWRYEDTEVTLYRGHRVFEHLSLPAEAVAGTWSQAVYQVDDSPRYEAVGRWSHLGERSTWLSEETWRPLPRREYSKRSDYQVLAARNRHTITPAGWVHEQDNAKLVLDEAGVPVRVIAHESGLNVYDRVDDVDFSAGRAYWSDTATYWSDIRQLWLEATERPGLYHVAVKVDDEPVYAQLFAVAKRVREDGGYTTAHRDEARAVIEGAIGTP
ncbi:MAG: DUF6607 family protein [Planctomycetota bacterium]